MTQEMQENQSAIARAIAEAQAVARDNEIYEELFNPFEEENRVPKEAIPNLDEIREAYQSQLGREVSANETLEALGEHAAQTGEVLKVQMQNGPEAVTVEVRPDPEQGMESQSIEVAMQSLMVSILLHDKQLQVIAMDKLIQRAEEELVFTENELDKAVDNLSQLHIEAEEALRTGKPVPGNYEKDTQALIANIREQQAKLEEVRGELRPLYETRLATVQAMEQQAELERRENRTSVAEQTMGYAKRIMQKLTDGVRSIGNFLHKRNEQFREGRKDAMQRIGDGAQMRYLKTIDSVSRTEQRFLKWFKDAGEQVRGVGDKAREAANQLKASLLDGVESVKNKLHDGREAVAAAVDRVNFKESFKSWDQSVETTVLDSEQRLEYMKTLDQKEPGTISQLFGRTQDNIDFSYNKARHFVIEGLDWSATKIEEKLAELEQRKEQGLYVPEKAVSRVQQLMDRVKERIQEVSQYEIKQFKETPTQSKLMDDINKGR